MALKPINRGVVPPGGLVRYRDPDTGWEYAHPYYQRTKIVARDYRVQQGLTIPHDWDEMFDRIMCEQNPRACVEIPDGQAETAPGLLKMAANFTRSMISWAKSGFSVVSYEEFRRRYVLCAGSPDGDPQCPYFGRFSTFGVMKCNKCGCSGVKLAIGSEHCPINKW